MPRPIGMLPISVLLPKGLREELLALAAAEDRNLSQLVRVVLMAHVERAHKPKCSTIPATASDEVTTHPAGGGRHG